MGFELVIFDCDGVLVDSEPAGNRVLARMLTEIGVPTTYEESVRSYKGRSMAWCLERVEALLGAPVPSDFVARHDEALLEEYRRDLRAIPGIEPALDAISAPVCVASSSTHAMLRVSLGVTRLLPRFDGLVFSAEDVARGKPAPDLFLHAARTLGARPEACAVIEDSAPGVVAAHAAGMTPFGFAGTGTADAAELTASGARVFLDMRELPGLLGTGR